MKELKITPPEGYEVDKKHSTFDCIKFKKIEKKGWEKFCENHPNIEGEYFIDVFCNPTQTHFPDGKSPKRKINGANRGLCKTKEDAEAIVALTQLRRMYCEAIKDEEDSKSYRNKGFTIQSGVWALTKSVFYDGILPFKSAENAWKFFEENEDLFEKIKVLFV